MLIQFGIISIFMIIIFIC